MTNTPDIDIHELITDESKLTPAERLEKKEIKRRISDAICQAGIDNIKVITLSLGRD